jgi:hypothetical protein
MRSSSSLTGLMAVARDHAARCLVSSEMARWALEVNREVSFAPSGRGGVGGLFSTGCAAGPLHPWLQPSAPLGPGGGEADGLRRYGTIPAEASSA